MQATNIIGEAIMRKIKKLLTTVLIILLVFCACLSQTSCAEVSFYCDPSGKTWYNSVHLPDTSSPFYEEYDGYYTIEIDKKKNVVFTLIDGEVLKGKLSCSRNARYVWTDVSIQFENGETATGKCEKYSGRRFLKINYGTRGYSFSDKKGISKEEAEEYRAQLISFLTNVSITGIFPTKEEIENNELYKRFLDYHQIDPGCNGPIVYNQFEKATIEKVEKKSTEYTVVLDVNGEKINCTMYFHQTAALIKDGQIKQIPISEVVNGVCLVELSKQGSYYKNPYRIEKMFCFENN